jgi:hypothetical protein
VTATATVTPGTLFNDGFESGNLSQWRAPAAPAQPLVAQQTQVASGAWAAQATSSGAAVYVFRDLSPAQTGLSYRFKFKLISPPSANNIYLGRLRTASGSSILGLYITSGGKLAYRNDVGGATHVSNASISVGQWYDVQIFAQIAGTSSQAQVWLDGAPVPELTMTENLGTIAIGRVQLGDNATTAGTYNIAYDDVVASTQSPSSLASTTTRQARLAPTEAVLTATNSTTPEPTDSALPEPSPNSAQASPPVATTTPEVAEPSESAPGESLVRSATATPESAASPEVSPAPRAEDSPTPTPNRKDDGERHICPDAVSGDEDEKAPGEPSQCGDEQERIQTLPVTPIAESPAPGEREGALALDDSAAGTEDRGASVDAAAAGTQEPDRGSAADGGRRTKPRNDEGRADLGPRDNTDPDVEGPREAGRTARAKDAQAQAAERAGNAEQDDQPGSSESNPSDNLVPQPTEENSSAERSNPAYRVVKTRQSSNSVAASAVVDSDPTTTWSTQSGITPDEAFVILDLGKRRPIRSLRWLEAAEGLSGTMRVEVSTDGKRWKTANGKQQDRSDAWRELQLKHAVDARFVRIAFTNPDGAPRLGGLAEVEVLPSAKVEAKRGDATSERHRVNAGHAGAKAGDGQAKSGKHGKGGKPRHRARR